MSNETIMLSKTYTKAKSLTYPLRAGEKLDGAPGKFIANQDGTITVMTRQGNPIHVVEHITKWLEAVQPVGSVVVGELYIDGVDFKEINGYTRRDEPDEDTEKLTLRIFDFYFEGQENTDYAERLETAAQWLWEMTQHPNCPINFIPGLRFEDAESLELAIAKFMKDNPESEGLVFRTLYGPKSYWKAGWRSPGMVKLKWKETIDLPIESYEEATSTKDGSPLGMIGRINVRYKGKVSGVGPGKMKHAERIAAFKRGAADKGKIIEIVHMPDESYEGLREGRFYRYRPDKD